MNPRKTMIGYLLVLLALACLLGGATGLTLTLMGSTLPGRIVTRIEREFTSPNPHPQFLPTPLPLADDAASRASANGVPERSFAIVATQPTATQGLVAGTVITDAAKTDAIIANVVITDVGIAETIITSTVETESIVADASESAPIASTLVTDSDPENDGSTEEQALISTEGENGLDVAVTASGAPSAQNSLPAAQSEPTLTPTVAPTSTPLPLYKAADRAVTLTGFNHQWQTWNNCGPTTLSMNLSFFGSPLNQADIAAVLRQYEDDKNVNPAEMVAFAQSQGFEGQLRVNGSSELIKTLLTNQIPVLIETWLEEEPNDGMGHYRLLTGYDDAQGYWIAYDSYVSHDLLVPNGPYQGVRLGYAETDALWHVFNRTYLLIYPPAKRPLVAAILGDTFNTDEMWRQAIIDNQEVTVQTPQDPFAWFNLGSTLTELQAYDQAAAAYDHARQLGLPWRMLWYQFGPFKAYYEVGRYDEMLALAYATLANTDSIEEIHYWKGQALAATGNWESAKNAWQQAITLNPGYADALNALAQR